MTFYTIDSRFAKIQFRFGLLVRVRGPAPLFAEAKVLRSPPVAAASGRSCVLVASNAGLLEELALPGI